MNIVCVISARGGSTGLPNKNIKLLCGKPLIYWSIKQAKKVSELNGIFVSTDNELIAKSSISAGASVPFLRSKKISRKLTPKFQVWKDALIKIEKFLKKKIDIFVDLDCTNPLRSSDDIKKSIQNLLKNYNSCDGVVSVSSSRKNPYFNMMEKDKNGFFVLSKKLKKWPAARQLAPKVYDQVASIYCFKREFIINKNSIYDGKILGHEVSALKSFDIDSQLDFEIIEFLFKKYKFNKQ